MNRLRQISLLLAGTLLLTGSAAFADGGVEASTVDLGRLAAAACGSDETPRQATLDALDRLTGAPALESLPAGLGKVRLSDLRKLDDTLSACADSKRAAGARGGVRHLLDDAERVRGLNSALNAALDSLKKLEKKRLKRSEWPPADLCPRCGVDWKALGDLLRSAGDPPRGFSMPEDSSLREIASHEKTLRQRGSQLCGDARRILEIDLGELDREFGYFAWTATRRSFTEIRTALSDSLLPDVCR